MIISHVDGMLWTPIRTRPKKEKKLAEYCKANSIRYYLPVRKSVKRYGRKTVVFYPPMFTGYIFCLLDSETYKLLVKSNAVFFKVPMDNMLEETLISDLINLVILEKYSYQLDGISIKPELVSGKQVKIINGPLQGLFGFIQQRKNNITVTVNIEMLGQSVTVDIDIEDIELEE